MSGGNVISRLLTAHVHYFRFVKAKMSEYVLDCGRIYVLKLAGFNVSAEAIGQCAGQVVEDTLQGKEEDGGSLLDELIGGVGGAVGLAIVCGVVVAVKKVGQGLFNLFGFCFEL